jgi:hypothetical protein
MPSRTDLSGRRTALRWLWDFAQGAGAASLVICVLLILAEESARRGISSTVFRYVGF